MLVVNKVAIHLVPAPSLVLLFQLATAAASVFALNAMKVVEADKLELAKVGFRQQTVFGFSWESRRRRRLWTPKIQFDDKNQFNTSGVNTHTSCILSSVRCFRSVLLAKPFQRLEPAKI